MYAVLGWEDKEWKEGEGIRDKISLNRIAKVEGEGRELKGRALEGELLTFYKK